MTIEQCTYEYAGFLRTLNIEPAPDEICACDSIAFNGDDLARWNLRDVPSEREWERIPASRVGTAEGVRLTGRFEDVRKIDQLAYDDPSFWVPLGTIGLTDDRLPIDTLKYAIAEVTYRCLTQDARPGWVWLSGAGMYFDWLRPSREWVTTARLICHFGFPGQIDRIVIRLYSPSRTTESIEIAQVRFRQLTPAEHDAIRLSEEQRRTAAAALPRYPILDEFLPLGTYADAHTASKLADTLGITFTEYWSLVFEDLVRHHHNCLSLEHAELLSDSEWKEILQRAESFDIRLLPIFDVGLDRGFDGLRRVMESRVRPSSESRAILAWSFSDEPGEESFQNVMAAQQAIAEVDRNHPICTVSRFASGYPLYAPSLPAAGMAYYTSHAPWEAADLVLAHSALSRASHFWMVAPAFIYATGTPEWSTCPEMRLLMNSGFANGARGWFTYAYHNEPIWHSGSVQRSLTGPFLSFSDLWLELDKRLEVYDALTPLLLNAKPARLPKKWFASSKRSEDAYQFPEGVPPTSSYRLRGQDFNLYFIVSNDVRGMASVNIDIPPEEMKGLYIYDLTDCIQSRRWVPMDLSRHWEMFPGQARVLFVAERSVSEHWRDVLFTRLRAITYRQILYDLKLAQMYSLDLREVESLIERAWSQHPIDGLETMDRARSMLFNRIYATPAITQARSAIIEISSMVCACDGALCRLMDKGRDELARELGTKVGPISSEYTQYRLALRQGRAAEIIDPCRALRSRTIELLSTIRGHA